MRCCFLLFETRFAVYLSNRRWKFHAIRALYNTVRLSWICSGFGDGEKTPGGMSGGRSVCVSELCVSLGYSTHECSL